MQPEALQPPCPPAAQLCAMHTAGGAATWYSVGLGQLTSAPSLFSSLHLLKYSLFGRELRQQLRHPCQIRGKMAADMTVDHEEFQM